MAMLVLLLLLASALLLFVGSQPRVPAPRGLAKPGLVAFDSGGHIYVQNVDGSNSHELTFGPDRDSHAAWSPDGSKLAYESELASDLRHP